jgi:tryptophan 2-monooxygenase
MLPPFPDPGVVQTWVCWQGTAQQWIDNNPNKPNPPAGFETVYWGWLALATKGITQGGNNVDFQSPSVLSTLMQNTAQAPKVAAYWQNYISAFQGKTFYSVLQDLFTGKLISPISGAKCDIPGGTVWTFDDFDKFGTVGIGSGGFGALYPINFVEIYRLIVDGLEHQQRFFNLGIRTLSQALQTNCATNPGKAVFNFNTGIRQVQGNLSSGFTLTDAKGSTYGPFSRVIMATTTRSMECTTNLVDPSAQYLTQRVSSAVRRTHVVSSVKIAARIKAFWTVGAGSTLPRVMQCDTTPCQAYTLDYNVTDNGMRTGVCFISYTWDDDAVKEQALAPLLSGPPYAQDPAALYEWLRKALTKLNITVTDPYSGKQINWADLLVAYSVNNDDPVRIIQWQSEPYFNGAFKLSQPGQDTYVQSMYWDYKKAGTGNDTGVYVAGDCASWTSGWVEGGLQTGLNAACAVIASSGGSWVFSPPPCSPPQQDGSGRPRPPRDTVTDGRRTSKDAIHNPRYNTGSEQALRAGSKGVNPPLTRGTCIRRRLYVHMRAQPWPCVIDTSVPCCFLFHFFATRMTA